MTNDFAFLSEEKIMNIRRITRKEFEGVKSRLLDGSYAIFPDFNSVISWRECAQALAEPVTQALIDIMRPWDF